MTVPVHQ